MQSPIEKNSYIYSQFMGKKSQSLKIEEMNEQKWIINETGSLI